jgi:hypothetical protein
MLEQWIETVCRTAGWHAPAPDARGHYHFRLDGGSRVDASSPDGRTLLLSADLGRLAPGSGGDALLRKVGLAALARAATDTGVVSLDTRRGTLCYDARHLLGIMRASEMHLALQRFLDELDFWADLCKSA